jgi:hypothetical protein
MIKIDPRQRATAQTCGEHNTVETQDQGSARRRREKGEKSGVSNSHDSVSVFTHPAKKNGEIGIVHEQASKVGDEQKTLTSHFLDALLAVGAQ